MRSSPKPCTGSAQPRRIVPHALRPPIRKVVLGCQGEQRLCLHLGRVGLAAQLMEHTGEKVGKGDVEGVH